MPTRTPSSLQPQSDHRDSTAADSEGSQDPPMKGVLDPPVSVANITVKEHEGETGTSPPPGQVRQPAFIPCRCRI